MAVGTYSSKRTYSVGILFSLSQRFLLSGTILVVDGPLSKFSEPAFSRGILNLMYDTMVPLA